MRVCSTDNDIIHPVNCAVFPLQLSNNLKKNDDLKYYIIKGLSIYIN